MRQVLVGVALLLEVAGVVVVVTHFNADSAWLFVGLTLGLGGMFFANAAFNCTLARNLDEEFDAGYRIGYRAGRRAPLVLQPVADLDTFRRLRSENGRLSEAPVRVVAGDSTPPRWNPADAN